MEHSLQRLTDSIAAYNPSTTAADELVAADDALSEDLETLVQHQRNVHRIAELKRVAQANDDRLKAHFRALAALRKELVAIPPMSIEPTTRNVSVDALLAHARFISPTTVPPTFRKQDPPPEAAPPPQASNGAATPAPVGAQGGEETAAGTSNSAYIPSTAKISAETLTEPEIAWLNPLAALAFAPWPEAPVIAAGALGAIQRMVEAGRDPGSVLSPEERVEAERRRKGEEERERVEEVERERRRMMLFDAGVGSRGRGRGTGESDVFDPDA
ncbi:hypothetical protein LTR53_003694 [Teratosphaeriaceae sp. CCFEE 6253]|nr:hypothetical protein LTR53_003694 [Teratosphaeriaceae sp. CCFEE 6253]